MKLFKYTDPDSKNVCYIDPVFVAEIIICKKSDYYQLGYDNCALVQLNPCNSWLYRKMSIDDAKKLIKLKGVSNE